MTKRSHNAEVAALRARVAQLQQESAEEKWMDEAIKALAFGTASATGQEFLQTLVQQLSVTLKVPYVLVTEWVPGRTDRFQTVAGWHVDHAPDPIKYKLPHTPCQKVVQDGEAFFPHDVQQLFPQDEYLTTYGIESYMGVVLLNRVGRTTGHLCVMDVHPFLFDTNQGNAILKVFAERAASELDRLRAEKALRASEARLYRFVAEAPVGLVIFDTNRRVLSANKTFCELTGYTEDELLGHTYARYTHPDDLPANLTLMDQFYQGVGTDYALEKRYIRKSGEIIWVYVKALRVGLPGHSGPFQLAAIQDITEQKHALAMREQLSQDLHDNLLQSLYAVGMQLAAGRLVMGKSPRKAKAYMSQAIDQLSHQVYEIRKFIGMLNRSAIPKPNLGQALQQVIGSFSLAGQTPPKLEIKDSASSFITPTQENHLLNIAREAISNSMRHADATYRSVQLSRTKNSIRLVIRDNGIGFVLGQRRRRGHGLANMSARAEKIHARLILDSAPGKGTCVTVAVPRKKRVVHA